jgi:mevalonate kinase
MPIFSASAPGKIILFGEHAVVYGQPAIAVPVTQVRAKATIIPEIKGSPGEVRILAPDVDLDALWAQLSQKNPIGTALRGVQSTLGIARIPACTVKITSTIPVASGLGSGAAVSVALIRAFAGFLGHPLPDEQVSAIAFEIEKIHHGTPSGIDNTVVTYAQPVFFVKGEAVETFQVAQPFTIVIGDTGIPAPTKESVGDVRKAWAAQPARYKRLFAAAGSIARTARQAIESGYPARLGPLMDENHEVLQAMGVSSPALNRLVEVGRQAGALGAKLSGGGRGGNMIALVENELAASVAEALEKAGAVHTIVTAVQ